MIRIELIITMLIGNENTGKNENSDKNSEIKGEK